MNIKRCLVAAVASAASVAVLLGAREASACAGRPTDPSGLNGYSYGAATVKTLDGAKVRVHYATTGQHAPDQASTRGDGAPDVVGFAVEAGDAALAKYAELGFKAPPSDASCPSNGGDDKLDVYIVAFAGADGSTIKDSCTGSACSSFVLAANSYLGYPSVKEGYRTVVAHELFHAVQNAYDSELDRTWAEGTAQWGMKQVYPDLSDFEKQLPAFFKENTRSLDEPPGGVVTGYIYGSAVWPLYLSLRHGPTTVREVFDLEGSGAKSLEAIDAVLRTKNSSLAESFPVFGAWNVATKSLAGTGGYPDAAKYPGITTLELADGVQGISSGLGYFAYRGTLDAMSGVSLETDETRNGGVLVPIEGGKPNLDKLAKLPANAQGEVIVVVAGVTTKKTDGPFTLRIGAPVEGSSSGGTSGTGGSSGSSGGGGASADDGGCAVGRAGSNERSGSGVVWLVGLGLVLGAARSSRRR